MKKLLIILLFLSTNLSAQQYNTAKPWAYWWWMGSAVSKEGISQNLTDYAKAGFGGMHIIPIYGVKGEEANFIPYLSKDWLEMLDFTLQEAKKQGMGIDMSLGSGWPYGGSYVKPEDAAKSFKIKQEGTNYILESILTNQKVKRAAPGAEGLVIDHFSNQAVTNYLKPFRDVFEKNNYPVRAFYNDSYEVYGANWTPLFFEKFKQLRGYDLQQNLDVLAKNMAETDREKRIWSDYNETLSDLLLTEFTTPVKDFAHQFGKIFRNESHGSPANILDLYATSDVPESEFFGSKAYPIPLYRQDPDYEESRFGYPGTLVLKMASSAAHVSDKKLVSSETSTWLGNHFKVSLSQIKPIIDESFTAGINHVFFHGMPYSPPKADFPGWLFYASTNYNQQSHFWNELHFLNRYIENCQTKLQASKPDNDILFFLPFYDLWHTVGPNAKTHAIDVHSIIKKGMFKDAIGDIAKELLANGNSFDFISDKQLINSQVINQSKIQTIVGTQYSVVLVPACTYFSLETLKALAKLKSSGAKILFINHLPQKVNGFFEFEKRQVEFDKLLPNFNSSVTNNVLQTLENLGIRNESIAKKGLSFIRKKTIVGTSYFISNLNNQFESGTITLASNAQEVHIFNPLTEKEHSISFKNAKSSATEINLSLKPGESIFVELLDKKTNSNNKVEKEITKITETIPLKGTWQIDFLKGQPFLPKSIKTDTLISWTELGDSITTYFNGYGSYSLKFNLNEKQQNQPAWLDLGDVRETAKITLNGKELGTAWCLPFRIQVPANLLKKENSLVVEVRNLSINQIKYLDKKGVNWRKFYDINIVDINYKPFNAAKWTSVKSGLLGEVKLVF